MTGLLNNRYRIVRELGRGGFGHTFLAEDTHMPSRRLCVIKQLKPAVDDPALYPVVQQRFAREAAILEELGESHEQIPKLYAYFTEGEQFYLVQERIQGATLAQKVGSDSLFDEARAREILLSLLSVLEYVHSKKIIHRDIKPDNIILRETDGRPVLIDFGAVKETFTTALDSGGQSFSIVIGSPGYMALEQAAGRPVYSSDLYSLAWTIIYLITGKHPRDLSDLDGHEGLWLRRVPDISADLAAVLGKAIQPMSRDRFRTAREMLKALQGVDAVATAPTRRYEAPESPKMPPPEMPPTVAAPEVEAKPQAFTQPAPPRAPQPPTIPFLQEMRAESEESRAFIEPQARARIFSLYILARFVSSLLFAGSTYLLYTVLSEYTAASAPRYWSVRAAQMVFGGAVTGLLQVAVLRKYLKHAVWWVLVSSLVNIPSVFILFLFYYYRRPTLDDLLLFNLVYSLSGWGLAGLAQWLILRTQVRRAWLWILASIAAALFYNLLSLPLSFLQGRGVAGGVIGALFSGLLLGIAQALCLLYFKRKGDGRARASLA